MTDILDGQYRKYDAIRERVREMIVTLGPGARLPVDRELSEIFGVSRPTIRKAIEELVATGELRRVSRQGVFVKGEAKTSSLTLGLIYPSSCTREVFVSTTVLQLQVEAQRRGITLLLGPYDGGEDEQPPLELATAEGIIQIGRQPIIFPDKPMVIPIDYPFIVPQASFVMVDDHHGGAIAAQYLYKLGHRRIAFIPPTDDYHQLYWVRGRYHGVCDTLHEHGAPSPIQLRLVTQSGFIDETVLAEMHSQKITALICANDQTAMMVISSLHRLGLRVPQDVSVLGFDDIPAASNFVPPLTTIKLPLQDLVTTTIDELERRITEGEAAAPRRILLPTELIERDSCHQVAAQDALSVG